MNKFKAYFARAVNGIHVASVYFAMILLVAMTLIISVNVFMRYVMNSGLTWAEEVSKLLVVWFTFIAMAIGVKQSLHISLHLLPKNLPHWLDRTLNLIRDISILIVAGVMLVYGKGLIEFTSRSIMPATEWPGSTLYFILPFAAVLVALEVIVDILGIDDDAAGIDSGFNHEGETDADS